MTPTPKQNKAELSKRQQKILHVIEAAIIDRGFPPTIREIGERCGLKSTSSVAYQLSCLEEKGFLRRDANKPRAVEVRNPTSGKRTTSPMMQQQQELSSDHPVDVSATSMVPLLGQIAAGSPITAEENLAGYYSLPEELVGQGELFMLSVNGDSMKDAGIFHGDLVVVRSQKEANLGDYVAAMIDGSATVKEWHRDASGTYSLMPCNEDYDPIPADDAELMGKVVTVLRRV
ncbi:transcriptional repressor LexA [Corynebacterium pseudopelargi]|uniref:LexA repressor n=1 Tax=Corynebacterium pseudopelargi TaxID=2080757 RepID=A0A3G6IU61_9CORY|nr:transcriptional repressor LexA [Corynebacterium pseudopelargi]AZA09107.1 LexA repressor [Corynebacterium pseudopelargi]